MGEIVAKFADGRYLVQEDKALDTDYVSGGVAFRIGLVHTVEKVLSIDAHMSGYPSEKVAVPLREVKVSGDTILPILRRADIGSPVMTGLFSGLATSGLQASGVWGFSGFAYSGIITLTGPIGSGTAALSVLSGVTSGLAKDGQLTSGKLVSGRLLITANVIGF